MSKTQPKQVKQQAAERGVKPKAALEGPAVEQSPPVEALERQGQAEGLPSHPTANGHRQAAILRMQRRQGNGAVQRYLSRRHRGPGKNGKNGRSTLATVQRENVAEEDGPTEAEKAAAQSAAQSAEGSAGQASTQAQESAGKALASRAQEQQNTQQAQQEAAQPESQAAPQAATQASPGAGPGGAEQASPGPGGGESATQAEGAGSGEQAPGESAPGEPAPKSAEEDAGFVSIVEQIKQKTKQQKKHAAAGTEAQEAQGAAEMPASEEAAQAQAGHVEQMQSAEAPPFDAADLKAQLMQKIQAVAPKTAQEADAFKSSNKLGGLKAEMQGKVTQEKSKSAEPMKQKSQEAPSTVGVAPKPVTPLQPPEPGSPPQQVNAGLAAPKPKSRSEVEKPLQHESRSLDQQMAEAEITEEQLAQSNEPEFESALEAKREAQAQAQEAPEHYRQEEGEQIAQAKDEATGGVNETLQSANDQRMQALGEVAGQQGQAKSADEQKRQEVGQHINSIFEKTKGSVERILGSLDAKVDPIFEAGAAAAQATFEAYVTAKMEAYKQRRYGGLLGWARWAQDKLLGMPGEVNAFYNEGRQLYLSQMDAVIDSVVAIIGTTLNEAKAEVTKGKQEIQAYVDQLPAELRKQADAIDRLAQQYPPHLQAIDARIDELQSANRGMLEVVADALGGVITTIRRLTGMISSVLGRAASAIRDIMQNPVGFLGNLITGIKTGLQNFAGNIAKHLKKGLMGWLFKTLSDAGIEVPDSFDLQGILSLAMQVLGLTWEAIRTRAVKLFGERIVGLLERVFDVFRVIKSEGLGGVFRFVREKATGIKDVVFEAIRDMATSEVVQTGIQKVIGILGSPAGAFIKAVEAIHQVISWFISNGQQIGSLVQAVLSSITAIAGGSVSSAAQLIEQSLARSIPVVMGFLARIVGLGDLPGKIRGIIERVRAPVTSAVDWILSQAGRVARTIGGALGGAESAESSAEAE
jgi:hypothetical protein